MIELGGRVVFIDFEHVYNEDRFDFQEIVLIDYLRYFNNCERLCPEMDPGLIRSAMDDVVDCLGPEYRTMVPSLVALFGYPEALIGWQYDT